MAQKFFFLNEKSIKLYNTQTKNPIYFKRILILWVSIDIVILTQHIYIYELSSVIMKLLPCNQFL